MSTAVAVREVKQEVPARWMIRLQEQAGQPAIDEAGRTAQVVIISEGLGNLRDRNYYTADAVRSAAEIFDGKQFYIDHPSAADDENRPERSVRDLAGYFFDTKVGEAADPETGDPLSACIGKIKFAESEPGRLAFEQMRAALEYQQRFPRSKEVYAGISINGGGISHPGAVKGMEVNVVTAIQEAFSADIVTKPARGGRFLQIVQEARRTGVPVRVGGPKPRAQEARAGGGGMATQTAARPKLKDTLREAHRAVRRLRRAVKEGKNEKLSKRLRAVIEAAKHILKFKEQYAGEGEERAVGKLMRVAERLRAARQAAENAAAEGKDPATIVADMKADIDNLADAISGVMGGGGGGDEEGAEELEREGEEEGEEEEGEEDEEDDESEGGPHPDSPDEEKVPQGDAPEGADRPRDLGHEPHRPVITPTGEDEEDEEDEDEDGLGGGYGMRSGEDEDEGEARRGMRYSCASCGETNRVLPPKGYKLARMGESKRSADGLEATVRRLQRMLESKERRFVSHNRETRKMLQENTQLRARVMALERLDMARKALREAGIPPDIMKPKALLPFEPDQWEPLIKGAKALKARETDPLRRGGAGPKDGSGLGGGSQEKDVVATFKEAYQKPREYPAG